MGSKMAASEVQVIDADTEAVAGLAGSIKYDDAAEAFDTERELRINRENREVWKRELDRNETKAGTQWKLSRAAEWTACVSMFVGFLLLIAFAIVNTYLG